MVRVLENSLLYVLTPDEAFVKLMLRDAATWLPSRGLEHVGEGRAIVASGACNNDVRLSLPYYVMLSLVIAFVNFVAIQPDCVMFAVKSCRRAETHHLPPHSLHTIYLNWHQDSTRPGFLQNQIFYA